MDALWSINLLTIGLVILIYILGKANEKNAPKQGHFCKFPLDKNGILWYNQSMNEKWFLPFLLFMDIVDNDRENNGGSCGCMVIVVLTVVLVFLIISSMIN